MVRKFLLIFLFVSLFIISPFKVHADVTCPKSFEYSPTNCPVCPPNYQYNNTNGQLQCWYGGATGTTAINLQSTNQCKAVIDCTKYPGTSCIDSLHVGQPVLNGCCDANGKCITDPNTPVGTTPKGPPPISHVGEPCEPFYWASSATIGSCPDGYQCSPVAGDQGNCTEAGSPHPDTRSACCKSGDSTCTGRPTCNPQPAQGNPGCAFCDSGTEYSWGTGLCKNLDGTYSPPPKVENCPADQCNQGKGCKVEPTPTVQPLSLCGDINANGTCLTAIGPLPTSLSGLLTTVFSIILSIAGVAALGLIIASGYKLMVSQGNPEQVKGAREQLTAAIIGLLFIIFSLVILQVIGVNILNIPGFK